MDKKDLALVKEFLDDHQIDILNTRAFKPSPDHYIISVGSIDKSLSQKSIPFKGKLFDV
jgi:hypothetical protein